MAKHFFRNDVILFSVAFYFLLSTSGCGASKNTVTTTPFSQQAYVEHIAQGDFYSAKMHLYGWRQADALYEKAYKMKATPELRDKRFLTLCLTAIREKDEQIINPLTYIKLDQLGEFTRTPRQQYLWEMVQHYRTAPVVRDGESRLRCSEKKEVDISLFDIRNSSLDAYLYLYLLNYFTYDFTRYDEELVALFSKHDISALTHKYALALDPLFIYSNFKKVLGKWDEIESTEPEFAEFFTLMGQELCRKEKLRKAAGYFEKALDLVPNYTGALNGMGNIYYFTVKNFDKAIQYYDRTLAVDEFNPVALFGKGVSLHNLQSYDESLLVLDVMLEKQPKHHGQAYYYKAYNYFFLLERTKAREMIDKAKKRLPRSGEVHFLSGRLYFNEEQYKKAEDDFIRALWDREFSRCYPLYYLGLAKLKTRDWSCMRDFKDSIDCLKTGVEKMKNRIKEVDALDLSESEKEWMRLDRTKKYGNFKTTAEKMTAQMNIIIADNKSTVDDYLKQVKGKALTRFQKVLEKDPARLNKLDRDGNTLLHKGIETGEIAVVKYLLTKGADLGIANSVGYKPLHWAVMNRQEKMVQLFLNKGAAVNITGWDNMTPLHDAAYGGYNGMVKLLMAAGADPYARTTRGSLPLDLAVTQGVPEVFPLLKPLHLAAENGHLEQVKTVLAEKPDMLESPDENGRCLLSLAAGNGHGSLVSFLLDKGAAINARDYDGLTARDWAGLQKHPEVTGLLTANGAVPDDMEMLQKQLTENQAILWGVNHYTHSWTVKTKNQFLVFDYDPHISGVKTALKKKRLSNGHIDPFDLKNQKVTVFVSSPRYNHRNAKYIQEWQDEISDITYVYGFQHLKDGKHVSLTPREKTNVNGIEVVSVGDPREGAGLLVTVDGLVIFYGLNSVAALNGHWDGFTRDIQFLSKQVKKVDIAFLPFPSLRHGDPELMKKSLVYILEKLTPKAVYILSYETDKKAYDTFAEKMAAKGLQFPFHFVKNRGDRFLFNL